MANCKRTQLWLSFFQYNTLVTSLVPYQYFIRLHFLTVFLLQCNTIDFSFYFRSRMLKLRWHCMMHNDNSKQVFPPHETSKWISQADQQTLSMSSVLVQWFLQHCFLYYYTLFYGIPLWWSTSWSTDGSFTTRHHVKNILRNLDTSKSAGVDDISAQILKECAEEL